MDDTSFASLSPTLLARKGGAKPAMRPQHGGLLSAAPSSSKAADIINDLGWNDMGHEGEAQEEAQILNLNSVRPSDEHASDADTSDESSGDETITKPRPLDDAAKGGPLPAITGKPQVRIQQETIAEQLERPAPQKAPTRARRSAIERGKRAAFTLRLDAERHLKLRLACTIRNRSAQQIVTDALDAMMGDIPELETLAAQVKRPGTRNA